MAAKEFALYNTETEELEDFQFMSQETADLRNKELRIKNEPQRWVDENEDLTGSVKLLGE